MASSWVAGIMREAAPGNLALLAASQEPRRSVQYHENLFLPNTGTLFTTLVGFPAKQGVRHDRLDALFVLRGTRTRQSSHSLQRL